MGDFLPIGLSSATAGYGLLYLVTLIAHVIFMNYVLAGTAYLAFVIVFTGGPTVERQRTATAMILRDWMPFVLSAAITAGVAPLLFIQILYQRSFYTAHLLLSFRWMAVLPVLIVGFYLLYVMKIRRIGEWRVGWRVLVGGGALACFVFTGWQWAKNHLVSIDESAWASLYVSGAMAYRNAEVLARFLVWFFGSWPTMALLVSWQLYGRQRQGDPIGAREVRTAGGLALGGLALAVVCGAWYYTLLDEVVHDQLRSATAVGCVILVVAGMVLEAIGWIALLRAGTFAMRWLVVISVGLAGSLVGTTLLREGIRLANVDITALHARHAQAAEVGGLPLFLFFFVLNALLIIWCIRRVRRSTPRAPA